MNFYRYRNVNTTAGVRVDEWKYSLVNETPKGYWITFHTNEGREYSELSKYDLHWISKTGRKKFAYETREAAWNSFQARKFREIKILERRLEIARAAHRCRQPKAEGYSQESHGLNVRNDCPYGF